jgi:flagellar protein FlaG
MSTRITPISADLGLPVAPVKPAAAPEMNVRKESPADYRLVIEEDQASGGFVYKTLNRVTGEVVQQFPREEVVRLRQRADYQAGAIIAAKA